VGVIKIDGQKSSAKAQANQCDIYSSHNAPPLGQAASSALSPDKSLHLHVFYLLCRYLLIISLLNLFGQIPGPASSGQARFCLFGLFFLPYAQPGFTLKYSKTMCN
jgi:hypothetical protein